MSKKVYYLWMVVLVVVLLPTLPYLCKLMGCLTWKSRVPILNQISIYTWLAVGMFAYFLISRFVKNNLMWFKTFSHELTHAFFAFICNSRMQSFQATSEQGGVVHMSGQTCVTRIIISLAPYCFPVYTYLLLSIRWMLKSYGLWFFDIVIGLTVGFHVSCFVTQTSKMQPDINQYPLSFSYLYIYTARIINMCIIIPSFFPNMNGLGNGTPLYEYGLWSCLLRFGIEWRNSVCAFMDFFL